MTDQTQIRRDPLVEHAVPLVAKAMFLADDANDLWEYFRDRVDAERHRIVEDAIREALEPLEERFAMDAVARVAATMASGAGARGLAPQRRPAPARSMRSLASITSRVTR